MFGSFCSGCAHQALHHEAEDEHQRRHEKHRVIGTDAELREAEERRVHRQHHQFALREVDDAHDAEDQIEPDRDKAIDPAKQESESRMVRNVSMACRADRTLRVRPTTTTYMRCVLTSLTFGCAASFGNTVTTLPDCHCTTVGKARVFWNLSSNFAPNPVA